MKSVISCVVIFLWSVSVCANESDHPPVAAVPSPIAIAKLDPKMDRKEVTVKFTVSELGGVAQLAVDGKAPTFVIEAASEHEKKDLTVWIEGELADVLERLQLSYGGANPLKKGTILVATGTLAFSAGAGDRKGHQWYALHVGQWKNFRIVRPD